MNDLAFKSTYRLKCLISGCTGDRGSSCYVWTLKGSETERVSEYTSNYQTFVLPQPVSAIQSHHLCVHWCSLRGQTVSERNKGEREPHCTIARQVQITTCSVFFPFEIIFFTGRRLSHIIVHMCTCIPVQEKYHINVIFSWTQQIYILFKKKKNITTTIRFTLLWWFFFLQPN